MKTNEDLGPETFTRHAANVYPALAMLAGLQLDVFTPLADGSLTVDELASRMQLSARKLRPLLYALVAADCLVVENDRFANTEESGTFFVRHSPRYLGGIHTTYAQLWSASLHTADSIRSGHPQAKHDFATMEPPALRAFIRGLDGGAAATARRLWKTFDFSVHRNLLDAGGGSGALAVACCRQFPALHATVAELANVVPVTQECIAEAGLAQRIDVCVTDLRHAVPPGHYDGVVLRSVLQVLGEDEASAVLGNAAATLVPGGRVYVVARMLDDSRLTPLDSVAANVMFLNVYDAGQAYTETEYREWFRAAGLTTIERHVLAGGYSIMTGIRPA